MRRLGASAVLLLFLPGCGEEEPGPSSPPPAPAPAPSGGADLSLDSFEGKPGAAPQGWRSGRGRWALAEDASAARGPMVLKQDAAVEDWAVILRDGAYAGDLSAEVRFKPLSGREDASGGLVLLAQDADNYYLCRANALEGNFRLYYVKGNGRVQLESASVQAPEIGTWHTLQMALQGDTLSCALDGRVLITHRVNPSREPAWKAGRVGLWTKADSVTRFDRLDIIVIK